MVSDTTAIASPWATSTLAPVSETGLSNLLSGVSRESALTIPALMRARNLICTTAARVLLVAEKDGAPLEDQPRWISRTDGFISPYHRMLWTVDDLLFYGFSLWQVTRDYDGRVIESTRVPYTEWEFTADGDVAIGNHPAAADRYILIPGIHEGILTHGAEVIPQALSMSRGVTRAVETPAATIELHQTNDRQMTPEDINSLIATWKKARRENGIAFTNNGIETKEHGAPLEQLLIEGRNAVAIDIARLCGIPASMVDASISGSSINYSNAGLRMAELISFGVAPLIAAVTARLGMDDMVPAGTTITADAREMVEYLTRLTTQDDENKPKDNPHAL